MKTRMIAKDLISLAAVAGLSFGLAGCGSSDEEMKKSKPAVRVDVVPARVERIEEMLLTTGDVVATNTVVLESTVEGPISFCPWREGDSVTKDEKVIEVERPLYRQELAAAEAVLAVAEAKLADLLSGARPEEIAQARESVRHFEDCTEFAQADLERIRSLVKSGSLPAETVEKARVDYTKCHTQLESAKERLAMLEAGPTKTEIGVARAAVAEAAARRDLAQAKLDECTLFAPFSGIVTEVYVRPGDLATPRQALVKMMEESSLVVRAGLPENCITDVKKGAKAEVALDAYPQKTFEAVIERVYPRLEQSSRTRLVEFRITDPVKLLPRMFARISVCGRVEEQAVVIPTRAIVATPRGDKVAFVVKDGKAVRRQVEVGIEDDERVQIVAGIEPGDQVVVAGNLNLKNGAVVTLGQKTPEKPKD